MTIFKERQLALAGKLTGKEQFLRDATLNISDVALLDNANDVEIDESLFEEVRFLKFLF